MKLSHRNLTQREIIGRVLELAKRDSASEPVIRLASAIVHGLPPRDELAETRAAWDWVRKNIRWIRGNALTAEQIQAPLRTLELKSGKCIDLAPTLAVLLTRMGHRVVFDLWDRNRDGFADHISLRDVTPAVVQAARREGVPVVTRNGYSGVHLETTPAKNGDGNARIFAFGEDVPNEAGGPVWSFGLDDAAPSGLASRPMAVLQVAEIAGIDGTRRAAPGQQFMFGGGASHQSGGAMRRRPSAQSASAAGFDLAFGRNRNIRSAAGHELALWRHYGISDIADRAFNVAAIDQILASLADAGVASIDGLGDAEIGNLLKKLKKTVAKVQSTVKSVAKAIIPKPLQKIGQQIEKAVIRPVAQVAQQVHHALDKNIIRPLIAKPLTQLAEKVGLKKPEAEEAAPAPEPAQEIPAVPDVPVEPQAQQTVRMEAGAQMPEAPAAAIPMPQDDTLLPGYTDEPYAAEPDASRGFGLSEDLIDRPEIGGFNGGGGVGSLAIADVAGTQWWEALARLMLPGADNLSWALRKKMGLDGVGDVGFVGPALGWLLKTAGPAAVAMLAEWLTGKIAGKKSVADIGDIGAVSAGAFVKNMALAAGMAVANDIARAFPRTHPLGRLARKFLRWSGHTPVSGVGELLAGVDIACCCDQLAQTRGVSVNGVDIGSFFKKLGKRLGSGLKRLPSTVSNLAAGVQQATQQVTNALGPAVHLIPGGTFLTTANEIAKKVQTVADRPDINALAQQAGGAIRSGNPLELLNAAQAGIQLRQQFSPASFLGAAPARAASGGFRFGMGDVGAVDGAGSVDAVDDVGALLPEIQRAAQILGSGSRRHTSAKPQRYADSTRERAGRKLARHRWGVDGIAQGSEFDLERGVGDLSAAALNPAERLNL